MKRRSQIASVQDSKKSKRNIDAKDHDAKAKIDGARLSGADGKAGRLKAQIETRSVHLHASLQEIQSGLVEANKLDLQGPVSGITIGSNPLKRDLVARITSGSLPLGPERTLLFDSLEIGPLDRIAITGKKWKWQVHIHAISILLDYITGIAGSLCSSRARNLCLRTSLGRSKRHGSLNQRTCPFQSYTTWKRPLPYPIFGIGKPRRGEKKLLLSMLFEEPISVLLLDEPTNHLDLPSRLALEKALGGGGRVPWCVSVMMRHSCIQYVIRGGI